MVSKYNGLISSEFDLEVGESMKKLHEQSLQEKDARFITSIIDDGIAKDDANHATTHAILNELLNRDGSVGSKKQLPLFGAATLDRIYYNLFVIGGEKFDKGSFTVPKTKALVESIEPAVKSHFFNLRDDSVVERLLTLPSLFMSENADYMRSRPGQKVLFGRIISLEIEPNDVRIFFVADAEISQQSITNISHNLGILSIPGCSELNNTHWTIKQVDLIEVLTDAGLLVIQND